MCLVHHNPFDFIILNISMFSSSLFLVKNFSRLGYYLLVHISPLTFFPPHFVVSCVCHNWSYGCTIKVYFHFRDFLMEFLGFYEIMFFCVFYAVFLTRRCYKAMVSVHLSRLKHTDKSKGICITIISVFVIKN